MNLLKITLITLFASLAISGFAQESKLLSKPSETPEDYKANEPKVIATVDWIENTPINENEELHKMQYGLLIQWISGSPTVTLSLQAYVMDYTKKNSDLLVIFMGGWTRYALQNEYTTDALQCNLAGVQSMIKVYKTGKLKKDKKMDELVKLEADGKLEAWLKDQIKE